MDDLVQFLRDRLDEDERMAKEAGERSPQWRLARPLDDAELGDAHWLNPIELKHVERHDPARVLAEVEAKRRLLDWLAGRDEWALDNDLWTWDSDDALLLLALPYADHPAYKPEWRP